MKLHQLVLNQTLTGIAEWYFPNGDLNLIGEFERSVLSGEVASFARGDRPRLRATFENGRQSDGPYVEYKLGWEDLSPWQVLKGEISEGQILGEWKPLPRVIHYDGGSTQVIEGTKSTIVNSQDGTMISGDWAPEGRYTSRGSFVGICVNQWPEGKLEGPCSTLGNVVGKAKFTRASDSKVFDATVNADGLIEYVEVVQVRRKKRDLFSRWGRELSRWGRDIKRNFEELICEIPEIFDRATDQDTKCNVAPASVSIDNKGDVFINGENIFQGPYSVNRSNNDLPTDAEIAVWFNEMEIENFGIDYFDFDQSPDNIDRALASLEAGSPMDSFTLLNKGSHWGPVELETPYFATDHITLPTISGRLRTAFRGRPEFGAYRDRKDGAVFHTGTDFATKPGEPIISPVKGEIIRIHKHPDGLNTIVIKSDKVTIRMLYITDTVKVGQNVEQGQSLGSAGALDFRYPGVPNHIHMTIMDHREKDTFSWDGKYSIQHKTSYCPSGKVPQRSDNGKRIICV